MTATSDICIHLLVPKTGDTSLDAIINEANRRNFAASIIQGILASYAGIGSFPNPRSTAKRAVEMADAMMSELDGATKNEARATRMFTLLKRINNEGCNYDLTQEVREFIEQQESKPKW